MKSIQESITTKRLARGGIIAALYAALSMLAFPIASGSIQIRVGEALTLLPLLFPEAAVGLFIGCIILNIITGCPIYDTAFGSLITLFAALFTLFVGKKIKSRALKIAVGGSFPVLLNALLLPLVWYLCYGRLEYVYFVQAGLIAAGQIASVYLLGAPIFISLDKFSKK